MAISKYGHWKSRFEVDPEKNYGFIYFIYNTKTHQYYIGKKGFKTKTRPWKSYKSSSRILKSNIRDSPDDFIFLIIEQYASKSGLRFGEVYSQIILETPTDDLSLNFYIDNIRSKSKEEITKRHKDYLKYLKGKYLKKKS